MEHISLKTDFNIVSHYGRCAAAHTVARRPAQTMYYFEILEDSFVVYVGIDCINVYNIFLIHACINYYARLVIGISKRWIFLR